MLRSKHQLAQQSQNTSSIKRTMVFLSSATTYFFFMLAVLLCLAMRSPSSSTLLPVEAFLQTTKRFGCQNSCRPLSTESLYPNCNNNNNNRSRRSPPPSLIQRRAHYEDYRPPQEQYGIEEESQAAFNEEEGYGQRPTISPRQRRTFDMLAASYGTGGKSFAQPVEPPLLSIGRLNGKTRYSGGSVRQRQQQQQQLQQRRGPYQRHEIVDMETKNFRLVNRQESLTAKGSREIRHVGAWQEAHHQQPLEQSYATSAESYSEMYRRPEYGSPEAGDPGSGEYVGNGNEIMASQSSAAGANQSYGRAAFAGKIESSSSRRNSNRKSSGPFYALGERIESATKSGRCRVTVHRKPKPDIISPELTIGRSDRRQQARSMVSRGNQPRFGAGDVLQHYGTGTYSFSQPIDPPDLTIGRPGQSY